MGFTADVSRKVKNGVAVTVTTSAGQKTGLAKGTPYWVFNIDGTNPAFINTNNETASATTSMPIMAGQASKFPVVTSATGTLNHISTGGNVALILIKDEAF